MKQLLASQELLFPRLFPSLQAAMKPLMARDQTGMETRTPRAQGTQSSAGAGKEGSSERIAEEETESEH